MFRQRVGIAADAEGAHMAVKRALNSRGRTFYANLLYNLFMLRVSADYYLEPPFPDLLGSPVDENWSINWLKAQELKDKLLVELSGLKPSRPPATRRQ